MTLLEIQDLSVSYATRAGTQRVVENVSLAVEAGEVVALVGESGSGKSTTAHAVLGLLADNGRIDGGRILLNGTDIAGWSDRRLRGIRGTRIGLVPQDPGSSLDPVKTIGSQVGEALRIHRRGGDRAGVRDRVLSLLTRVGLDDPARRAKQYPHELSGGMRQRVLIAIAIALEPDLIIADEPTSALDATVQRRILDLLDDLREEFGTAVLFVTHDLGVAADRSQRIVVLKGGEVQEQGGTADVLASPKSAYTRTLLANAPALAQPGFRTPHAPLYLRDAGGVASEDPYAIRVSNLVKEFGSSGHGRSAFRAVDDVSFDVRRGSTHALVGESGSGKTTTARLVVRLAEATAGTVLVDGEDVGALRARQVRELRRRIQLVYQNPFASLDPRQSVRDIVAEPLRNFGILDDRDARRRRAAELVDRVALPAEILGRRPRELSGGQRQRVAIARALAVEPEVLVLDEAVSALDVTVQAQILALLDGLQRDLGLTYLFISHDLAVVRAISDTVSVMRTGRVVESGTTEQIFTAPGHEYTRELLASVPRGRAARVSSDPADADRSLTAAASDTPELDTADSVSALTGVTA
ncbi:dipeptide ABC transporter ATP-binding protein [Leifsonia poae]|uniref:dipeptide ABC transporter ATP-binding protein n=1 Tax=Leifsonia poae TaxID=110933 RepID=UPI001CBD08F9|nr:ABC transporter ATP-binding protein [Leifsonia poae]